MFKKCEELTKEKLIQILREVKNLEERIEELPVEIMGYRPLEKIISLKLSIESSIEDLEKNEDNN